jgi:hypothetical protein
MYYAKLTGFKTLEQAKGFLDWYEGQGEQDDTIGMWIGSGVTDVLCDVQQGMIIHEDGVEYHVDIFTEEDEE